MSPVLKLVGVPEMIEIITNRIDNIGKRCEKCNGDIMVVEIPNYYHHYAKFCMSCTTKEQADQFIETLKGLKLVT